MMFTIESRIYEIFIITKDQVYTKYNNIHVIFTISNK